MRPTWKPFASDMLAEQQLHFSLRLMTGGDTSENEKLGVDVFPSREGGKKNMLICFRLLISLATGGLAITQGLADFAATVKDAKQWLDEHERNF